jgi:hypothetical protein
MKKLLFRAALVVVYLGLGIFLFVVYRGHTLLVDNHNLENAPAPRLAVISIDGQKAVKYNSGDRDRVSLAGSRHTVRIEVPGERVFEGEFTLPLKYDMYILYAPRLLSGIEPAVEVFHTVPDTREAASDEPVETGDAP